MLLEVLVCRPALAGMHAPGIASLPFLAHQLFMQVVYVPSVDGGHNPVRAFPGCHRIVT